MAKRRRHMPARKPGPPPATPAAAASTQKPVVPKVPGQGKRVVTALLVVFLAGVAGGVAVSFAVPSAAIFDVDRARYDVLRDTSSSLEAASSLADGGDPSLFASGALANALLLVDHAGGAAEKKRADSLLKTSIS